jgi:dTDP-4-amino-4,6-dideoxygalactose transaminase
MGDLAAFSFCQDKVMTTAGEGGMVTTNSDELWNAVWSVKDHGKSYNAVYLRQHAPGFRWLLESFGTNARMTEVQSAIGRVALGKVPGRIAVSRAFAQMLTSRLASYPGLRVPQPPSHVEHSYYKYYAFIRPERLVPGWTYNRIIEEINAEGIQCFNGSCSELYQEKAFPPEWRPAKRLQVAQQLGETSLMFLVHPTLSEQYIMATSDAVGKVISAATQMPADESHVCRRG